METPLTLQGPRRTVCARLPTSTRELEEIDRQGLQPAFRAERFRKMPGTSLPFSSLTELDNHLQHNSDFRPESQ